MTSSNKYILNFLPMACSPQSYIKTNVTMQFISVFPFYCISVHNSHVFTCVVYIVYVLCCFFFHCRAEKTGDQLELFKRKNRQINIIMSRKNGSCLQKMILRKKVIITILVLCVITYADKSIAHTLLIDGFRYLCNAKWTD